MIVTIVIQKIMRKTSESVGDPILDFSKIKVAVEQEA
jgi:hypothetical protein